jgi:hypothetical protein
MRLHGNAALSWRGRRRLVERVVVEGWTLAVRRRDLLGGLIHEYEAAAA